MKKTFPLSLPDRAAPRVIESIKKDVRKYIKRERRKELPEGVDYWDFACKAGKDESVAEVKHVEELIPAIDQASAAGEASLYIEILATPGVRKRKEKDCLFT